MPKPICVPCKRFYKPEKNGVFALEQMPRGEGAEPGTSMEPAWEPYKIWRADLYKCAGCGHEIITGYGIHALSEHYEPHFPDWLDHVTHTVNDC